MQNTKNVETVERERERVAFLDKENEACISVALKINLNNLKNKDPCYLSRLLCLPI